MGAITGISWTDHTFSPWIGCQRVSPGCEHCYAEGMAAGLLKGITGSHAGPKGQTWGPQGPRVVKAESGWREPLAWNRKAQAAGVPAFVFCSHLSDVFEDLAGHRDESAVNAARTRLWTLIAETPWLVWLLLTKRPQNVARMVPADWMPRPPRVPAGAWPSNVWIGCTVEDQQRAAERLPYLLDLSAPVRFASYEPALGPVDWARWFPIHRTGIDDGALGMRLQRHGIDWLIIGSESGSKARPFRAEWARDAIRQCKEASVAPWMKQLGDASDLPKTAHHGADPSEWPEDLRVQERPTPATPGALP